MIFDSWSGLIRLVVVGVLAYMALIAVLRLSGKRTLSKMNAFDLVVTISLGSTLATILLSKDVALLEGVLAFALLAVLQFIVAWLSLRWKLVQKVAKSNPRRLLNNGEIDQQALSEERVTDVEVMAAIRGSGYGGTADIACVVLETDGSFSVIPQRQAGKGDALP
jgi:uncharacterized membrane protein YcaP (DUF421 family)